MSAVESNFPQIGAPGNSLVACMPLTGLSAVFTASDLFRLRLEIVREGR